MRYMYRAFAALGAALGAAAPSRSPTISGGREVANNLHPDEANWPKELTALCAVIFVLWLFLQRRRVSPSGDQPTPTPAEAHGIVPTRPPQDEIDRLTSMADVLASRLDIISSVTTFIAGFAIVDLSAVQVEDWEGHETALRVYAALMAFTVAISSTTSILGVMIAFSYKVSKRVSVLQNLMHPHVF
jgi:hypothetical protein